MSWAQLFGFRSRRPPEPPPANGVPVRLLVVTGDDHFYASLANIANANGWGLARAYTVQEGAAVAGSKSLPLIIYDWDETRSDWRDGLGLLTASPELPCVLLASRVVDENLREEVIRFRGYDVLSRSASQEEMMRSISFAWFWIRRSR